MKIRVKLAKLLLKASRKLLGHSRGIIRHSNQEFKFEVGHRKRLKNVLAELYSPHIMSNLAIGKEIRIKLANPGSAASHIKVTIVDYMHGPDFSLRPQNKEPG